MYIQKNKSKGKNGKVYKSTLLCHKYREAGKIKTQVLANFSHLPDNVVTSIGNILKYGEDELVKVSDIKIAKAIDYGLIFNLKLLI